jgi:hypothetical protein
VNTPDPDPGLGSQQPTQKHWLAIAGTSLLLGSLIYAGLLFPFAVTDGLLGLDCHGWVKGPRGAASLLFILGWGCAVAIMAGRVYGRTETLDDLLRIKTRLLNRAPAAGANEADGLEAAVADSGTEDAGGNEGGSEAP